MFDLDFDKDDKYLEFEFPEIISKDDYIIRTKKLLQSILDYYDSCYSYKKKGCDSCYGGEREEGGYITECYSCKGTGEGKEVKFNKKKFTELMEHSIMFSDSDFFTLLKSKILE